MLEVQESKEAEQSSGATHKRHQPEPQRILINANTTEDKAVRQVTTCTPGPGRARISKDEEWEARRRYNNLRRREKAKEVHRNRVAATKAQEEALLSALSEDQAAQRLAEQAAERAERAAAAAAQEERVAAALAADDGGCGPEGGDVLRVVIDCSFSPLAAPKELRSLCKQLENAAACNKRHPAPACLTLTSWGEPLASVAAPCGAAGWRVVRRQAGAVEAFGPDKVVVLSPDAPEPLDHVDLRRVYVIGGIVDRTHRKGLTRSYAESYEVPCRRLPIAEYAEQLGLGKGTRKCPVLNIDDVVRALLIGHHTGDWVAALLSAIPARKFKPQLQGMSPPAQTTGAAAVEERKGQQEVVGQEEEEEDNDSRFEEAANGGPAVGAVEGVAEGRRGGQHADVGEGREGGAGGTEGSGKRLGRGRGDGGACVAAVEEGMVRAVGALALQE